MSCFLCSYITIWVSTPPNYHNDILRLTHIQIIFKKKNFLLVEFLHYIGDSSRSLSSLTCSDSTILTSYLCCNGLALTFRTKLSCWCGLVFAILYKYRPQTVLGNITSFWAILILSLSVVSYSKYLAHLNESFI